MKLSNIIIALLTVLCLTGCDWVRSNLGLLTSSQLNELKEGYQKEQADKKFKADSIALIQDSLSINSTQNGTLTAGAIIETNVQKGLYYIIFGGFKDKENVRKMADAVAGIGMKPVSIISESGTMEMVAAGPYSTEEEATKVTRGLPQDFQYDLSDVWIYKAK
jgi:ribosomal protein S8E